MALLLTPFVTTLALGPALAPLVVALGGTEPHVCACGMKPGTCGCPECARLAGEGDEPTPVVGDVLRSCDDHGHAAVAASRLPPCVTPATFTVVSCSVVAVLAWTPPTEGTPRDVGPPPTRPPRREPV